MARPPKLSRGNGVPAHVQIEQWLIDAIASGEAAAGDRLPAERDLAGALLRCAFPEQRRGMIRMLRWIQMASARPSNATRTRWQPGTSAAMSQWPRRRFCTNA